MTQKNKRLVESLQKLNAVFYAAVAHDFDRTRSRPWKGWDTLRPLLISKDPLTLLDVGCGNGRFYSYVLDLMSGSDFEYVGIDTDPTLLSLAQRRVEGNHGIVTQVDVMSDDWHAGYTDEFDVVVAFGLMHHIPTFDLRIKTLLRMRECVKPNGFLMVTFWNYQEDQRFMRKVVSIESSGAKELKDLTSDMLEEGDVILTWNNDPQLLRYVHVFEESELDRYSSGIDMSEVMRFDADGKSDTLNTYVVWKKD